MANVATFGGFGVSFYLGDEFSTPADAIKSKFSELEGAAGGMAENISLGLEKVKQGIVEVGIGLGLLAPVGLGIKYAAEFETAEIGLQTFLGSAEAAHAAFENIKQDAIDSPVFGSAELLMANRAIISTGKSAEDARTVVNDLSNAILATGGGNAELARMAVNLQQIANTGKATSGDIKQFAYAGVNIYKLLADATGKNIDQVKELDVTYDLLSASLRKASMEGGMYFGATERAADSVTGKLANISEGIKFSLASIGQAIFPIVKPVLQFVADLLESFREFAETGIGRTVIRIGVAALAFVSLTLIVKGLITVFSGLKMIIAATMAPMLPFLAIAGLIIGALIQMAGGVDNFMTVLKGLGEVFMSAGKEGFTMSESMQKALEEIGLLDFVVSMGTWFVRIKEFFSGMVDGAMEVGQAFVTVFSIIWDVVGLVLSAIIDILGFFGIEINRNTDSLESWADAGRLVSYVLGILVVNALLSMLAPLASVAVAFVAAFWLPMLIILAVIAVVWVLYEAISYVWDAITGFFGDVNDEMENSALGKDFEWDVNNNVNRNSNRNDTMLHQYDTNPAALSPFNNIPDQGLNDLADMNAENAVGRDATVVQNTTEKVKNITLVSQIDSEEVSRKVYEKQELDAARQ